MADDWATASEAQEAKELSGKVETLSIGTSSTNGLIPTKENEQVEEAAPSPADVSLMRKALCRGIIESKNNVEILHKDPKSPLYSIKTFEALNLRKELLEGIYSMGFKLPSKIQEAALPMLLANPPKNLIAQSQSGTGKTAAFSLSMLSRINSSDKCTQALCLSPTYELALQTAEAVKRMGKHCTDITIRCAVKGETLSRGTRLTEHIVIGTPGKVVDWVIKMKALDLTNVKVFVFDEADVMIATQGHQDQSVRIHKLLPKNCQMMLFSATYEEGVMKFAEAIIPDPIVMRLKREEETLDNIRQMYVECKSQEEKYLAIANIYTIPVGQSMFFCKTKMSANWLHKKMLKDGHHVALLTDAMIPNQGKVVFTMPLCNIVPGPHILYPKKCDLTPEERLDVLTRYRLGKERVLICTNVLARGIDIEQVTLVVNYDLPEMNGVADCETYLHRIGRTGRFGKTGNAINIVDGDRALRLLHQIEKHFNIQIEKLDYKDFNEIDKLAED